MHPSGPSNAQIMLVGEAPGEMEVWKGQPFVGPSGQELDKMLNEAGILRSQCFVTNVCQERPPGNDMGQWLVDLKNAPKADNKHYPNRNWVSWKGRWAHPAVAAGNEQLAKHIALVRPRIIIALGNTALFALTGEWGIKKWRGSQLVGQLGGVEFKVIPAYHPAAVLRDWTTRAVTVQDFRRAKRESLTPLPYRRANNPRIIRPTFNQVCKWFGDVRRLLAQGPVLSSTDIETRAGHIACWGAYIKGLPTICIPFMCVERMDGYWNEGEEAYVWSALREIVTHPNFKVIGQNWAYDSQYHYRWFLATVPVYWDTMLTQHCMYPGTPKGLDYLASLYCDYYRYWKDDGKHWDPSAMPEDDYWAYNCDDTEYTYEVYEAQRPVVEADSRLRKVWDFQTNVLSKLLFKAMCRGIRADVKNKAALKAELEDEIRKREKWLCEVLGHPLNWNSPLQVRNLFYVDLRQREVINRKNGGGVTTNDNALDTIAKREPLLRPIIQRIQELRSIGVFKSTFVEARLDRDYRIRCSFNIGGTITFRLSSSENAFGSGLNLQNIPKGSPIGDKSPDTLELPNIRKLFIPDDGMTMFDMDLDRADLQVVVWEADDEVLREALRKGIDLHLLNAGSIFGIAELNEVNLTDPEFLEYAKEKYERHRQFAKVWVHGTNYGGGDRTMAANAGITVRENERYRAKWFGEHPGILAWHRRTEDQLKQFHWVENRFGYRFYFFDRIEGLLPEALAWVPQSTVGCVINRAWDQIDRACPDVEVLIQVHDALVGQFPTEHCSRLLQEIPVHAKVVVPYDRPLVIPVGLKTSSISWGHCK